MWAINTNGLFLITRISLSYSIYVFFFLYYALELEPEIIYIFFLFCMYTVKYKTFIDLRSQCRDKGE